ncbi:MAG: hypothetical protein MI739_06565 [Bacteroidales bacterium]|nr:hypothetical protein [Bacteroidales bacterium]
MAKYKYLIILILSFILYGNTLWHDYALDDAIVITQNEYTVKGFDGIKDIFCTEFFNGFFEHKGKNLVAGGRYRPLSMVSFAIEWQLLIGSPLDGLNKKEIEKRLNNNVVNNYITPYNKLVKDLAETIHESNLETRKNQQENILSSTDLHKNEITIVKSNLIRMHQSRKQLLFVSHLINILLYAFSCMVLLRLLELAFSFRKLPVVYKSIPYIAVLLFLFHPIHTEVVANIKGRDEILSLLGASLAMLFVFKYLQSKKIINLFFSFIFFIIGLFSKEIAVTFVLIIPLSIYFFANSKSAKTYLITIFPLLIASAIYFYARHQIVGGMSFESSNELMNNSFLGMTFFERYATIFYTLLIYLKLLVFPHPLTFDYYPYHIQVMNWNNILPILSLLIYIALAILAVYGFKKKKLISFGILFYLITLAPTSNILFPIGVFMNERFIYASSLGIILVLSCWLSVKIPLFIKKDHYLKYLFFTILIVLGVKTITRNKVWKNDFTLFTSDVQVSSNSAKSNASAGGKLIEEAIKPENINRKSEYLQKSIFYLNRAIKIHPKYKEAYLLLGNAHWELYHNLDSTFKYYKQVLKLAPKHDEVYNNLFLSNINNEFEKRNRAKLNAAILHELEKYNSQNFYINYNLGRIYGRYLNNISLSKGYLEKAVNLNPQNINVYKDLGVAYGISKEYTKSTKVFLKAISLDDSDLSLKINLVMSYTNLGDFKKALFWIDNVLTMPIEKKEAPLLITLGNICRRMNNVKKAQECFTKAQNIGLDDK